MIKFKKIALLLTIFCLVALHAPISYADEDIPSPFENLSKEEMRILIALEAAMAQERDNLSQDMAKEFTKFQKALQNDALRTITGYPVRYLPKDIDLSNMEINRKNKNIFKKINKKSDSKLSEHIKKQVLQFLTTEKSWKPSSSFISELKKAMSESPLWEDLILDDPLLREVILNRATARAAGMVVLHLLQTAGAKEKPDPKILLSNILYAQTGLLGSEIGLVNEMFKWLAMEKGVAGPVSIWPEDIKKEIIENLSKIYIEQGKRFFERDILLTSAEISMFYKKIILTRADSTKLSNFIERASSNIVGNSVLFHVGIICYEYMKARFTGNYLFLEDTAQTLYSLKSHLHFMLFSIAASGTAYSMQRGAVFINKLRSAAFISAIVLQEEGSTTTKLIKEILSGSAKIGRPFLKFFSFISSQLPLVAGAVTLRVLSYYEIRRGLKSEKLLLEQKKLLSAKSLGEIEEVYRTIAIYDAELKSFSNDLLKNSASDLFTLVVGSMLTETTFRVVGKGVSILNNVGKKLVFTTARVENLVKKGIITRAAASRLLSSAAVETAEIAAADAAEIMAADAIISVAERSGVRMILSGVGRVASIAVSSTAGGFIIRGLVLVTAITSVTAFHTANTVVFFAWMDIFDSSVMKTFSTWDILNQIDIKKQQLKSLLAQAKNTENINELEKQTVKVYNQAASLHYEFSRYRVSLRSYIEKIQEKTRNELNKLISKNLRSYSYLNWYLNGADARLLKFSESKKGWDHPDKDDFYVPHPCYEYTGNTNKYDLEHVYLPPSELYYAFKEKKLENAPKRDWFLFLLYVYHPAFEKFRKENMEIKDIPVSWYDIDLDDLEINSKEQTDGFNLKRFLEARKTFSKYAHFTLPKSPPQISGTGPQYHEFKPYLVDIIPSSAHMNTTCKKAFDILTEENHKFLSAITSMDPAINRFLKEIYDNYQQKMNELYTNAQKAIDSWTENVLSSSKLKPDKSSQSAMKGFFKASWNILKHTLPAAMEWFTDKERENAAYIGHHIENFYPYAKNLPISIPDSLEEEMQFWLKEIPEFAENDSLKFKIEELMENIKLLTDEQMKNTILLFDFEKIMNKADTITNDLADQIQSSPHKDINKIVACLVVENIIRDILIEYYITGTYHAYSFKGVKEESKLEGNAHRDFSVRSSSSKAYSTCMQAAFGKKYLVAQKSPQASQVMLDKNKEYKPVPPYATLQLMPSTNRSEKWQFKNYMNTMPIPTKEDIDTAIAKNDHKKLLKYKDQLARALSAATDSGIYSKNTIEYLKNALKKVKNALNRGFKISTSP